jgi:hypothetical protein
MDIHIQLAPKSNKIHVPKSYWIWILPNPIPGILLSSFSFKGPTLLPTSTQLSYTSLYLISFFIHIM